MIFEFTAIIFYWRGPAPYYFVAVPAEQSADLKSISRYVTYGWGMIPVTATIGETEWTTSLFAKNGGYVVPIKDMVREVENLGDGDAVTVRLAIRD